MTPPHPPSLETVPAHLPAPSPHRRVGTNRIVLALFAAATFASQLLLTAQGAGAQVPDAVPSSAGLPAAPLVTKLLGWLRWGGLAGALASILVGAGIWGLSTTSGNGMYGTKGKTLLIGGLVGGALCGLAPALVNAMYAG